MVVARGEVGEMGSYCLMNIELRFWKVKKVLEMDGGDGCTTVLNVSNATKVIKICLSGRVYVYFTVLFFFLFFCLRWVLLHAGFL